MPKNFDSNIASKLLNKITRIESTGSPRPCVVVSQGDDKHCASCGRVIKDGDYYYSVPNVGVATPYYCEKCPPVLYKDRLYGKRSAKYAEVMSANKRHEIVVGDVVTYLGDEYIIVGMTRCGKIKYPFCLLAKEQPGVPFSALNDYLRDETGAYLLVNVVSLRYAGRSFPAPVFDDEEE